MLTFSYKHYFFPPVAIHASCKHACSYLSCNDSHYHIVITNTPVSSQLMPKTHLYSMWLNIALPKYTETESYNWPQEMTVGMMYSALQHHISSYLNIYVALIIYVLCPTECSEKCNVFPVLFSLEGTKC